LLSRRSTAERGRGATTELDYLLIGHVTQDRVDNRFVLGGTATYSALTARNLGQRVGVLTSAAFEPGLVDVLHGIQVARLPAEETTRFVNTYVDQARVQHVEARAEILRAEQLLPEWQRAPIVHLAPIAAEMESDIVDSFPEALIGVTPQGWMRAWDEQGLVRPIAWPGAERVLARADVVIFSEQDVEDQAAIDRYASQARLLVVTRGERGATIYQGQELRHVAAFQCKRQVDPTGAGDVFAAAYLIHFNKTRDPFVSAEFANCVASFAVEKRHFGGIPTLDLVAERWKSGKRRKRTGPL
jgi:sugar/nucleoside kinase (ribokinase family)